MNWSEKVLSVTSKEVYKNVQFIHDVTIIGFGSSLQDKTCNHLNIPLQVRMEFWSCYGQSQMLSSLRVKRQTITTSMKNRFYGESKLIFM